MMKMVLHEVALPLQHTFTTSHGSAEVQPSLILELRDTNTNCRGFGEGCPCFYHGASLERMVATLEAARPAIESFPMTEPTAFWDAMLPHLGNQRAALCALDQAAHDLWGKRLGKPVYALWELQISPPNQNLPLTDYTIGLDSIETMIAKMKSFSPWPIFKIKLGTPDDIAIIRALRQHTEAIFRVDANTGWTADETIQNAKALKPLGVEFIEQPLPADDWAGMRQVMAESALPIIADESCVIEEDIDRCNNHFHGVNIKLTKCGGLTPARRMIERARPLGLKVMVGCMTESTVGCSAIAQLLPLLDYVDMDGPLLIAKDIATGIQFDQGRIIFPTENGCGVRML